MNIPNAALAYRETASIGASRLGMVVLLYDRLLQDIKGAIVGMKTNQVEARSVSVNHALLVLQELQGKLDFASGGAAARQLDEFYSHTRAKLLEAQIRQSPELMIAQAQALFQIRECWAEIERSEDQLPPEALAHTEPAPTESGPAKPGWGA